MIIPIAKPMNAPAPMNNIDHVFLIAFPSQPAPTYSIKTHFIQASKMRSCRPALYFRHTHLPGLGSYIMPATAPLEKAIPSKKAGKTSFKTTSMVKKQVKVKGFKPSKNGFKFPNRFPGFPLPPALKAVIDTSKSIHGLCGGMVFAVIDFKRARRKLPALDHVPAEDT